MLIKEKIDNIKINKDDFNLHFNKEIEKLGCLDSKSDQNIKDYFLKNYKNLKLFHDPYHPTNILFYEIFRQILLNLDIKIIYNDLNFINTFIKTELCFKCLPILPDIKKTLNLQYDTKFYTFTGSQQLYLDIYDYYYIRLSKQNFKNYLVTNFIPFYKFKYIKD